MKYAIANEVADAMKHAIANEVIKLKEQEFKGKDKIIAGQRHKKM